jgi:hypothetical protein
MTGSGGAKKKRRFTFQEHVSNFGFDLSATTDQMTRDAGLNDTHISLHK